MEGLGRRFRRYRLEPHRTINPKISKIVPTPAGDPPDIHKTGANSLA